MQASRAPLDVTESVAQAHRPAARADRSRARADRRALRSVRCGQGDRQVRLELKERDLFEK